MARSNDRGGAATRARIAETASGLFHERGFDAVTVADVARAAGVSSVTVFSHFARKEDLFLDRSSDAADLLRAAVRGGGDDPLAALERTCLRLADGQHPLSGLDPESLPFLRTVAGSPALIARTRGLAAELQDVLADELRQDAAFSGDPQLLAALFVAGYATVLAATARCRLAGDSPVQIADDHRTRLARLFTALRSGLAD